MTRVVGLLLATACATGSDETGGGGFDLPTTLPGTLEADDPPELLGTPDDQLTRPWVAPGDTSADLVVWFGVELGPEPTDGARIDRALGTLNDEGRWSLAREPEPALTASAAWEAGRVTHPSVLLVGDQHLMAYVGGESAGIGIARSDGGAGFQGAGAPTLEPTQPWEAGTVSHPSLVEAGGRLLLLWLGGQGAGLGIAESTDGGQTFARLAGAEPVFEPAVVPEPIDPNAPPVPPPFDAEPLTGAAVVAERTPLDRERLVLWYSADGAIGLAASYDGLSWSRSAANPLLVDEDFGVAEPAPSRRLVLHVRNLTKKKPSKGRALGLARFR